MFPLGGEKQEVVISECLLQAGEEQEFFIVKCLDGAVNVCAKVRCFLQPGEKQEFIMVECLLQAGEKQEFSL